MALEGTLSKWTNVMKGWQNRWFVLEVETSLLSYYTVSRKYKVWVFVVLSWMERSPDKKNLQRVTIKIMGEATTLQARTSATFDASIALAPQLPAGDFSLFAFENLWLWLIDIGTRSRRSWLRKWMWKSNKWLLSISTLHRDWIRQISRFKCETPSSAFVLLFSLFNLGLFGSGRICFIDKCIVCARTDARNNKEASIWLPEEAEI